MTHEERAREITDLIWESVKANKELDLDKAFKFISSALAKAEKKGREETWRENFPTTFDFLLLYEFRHLIDESINKLKRG